MTIFKIIKPRFEIKSQSLHYFHAYAARDIDMASLSDSQPPPTQPDCNHLIPTIIILTYLGEFKDQAKNVVRHIPSRCARFYMHTCVLCQSYLLGPTRCVTL